MTTTPHHFEEMPTAEWLTAKEAAKYLKVKPRTLLLWVRQGKLQAFALSGVKRHVWRFRKQDLDAVFSNRRMSLGKSLDGGGGSSFPV